jgi:NDP-sugar pyrophosphorylase family protein
MPDLMLRLKNNGEKVGCFKMSGLWLDLGRLEDLENAQEVFEKNRRTILPK